MDAGDQKEWTCESCDVSNPATDQICQTCNRPKIAALGSYFNVKNMSFTQSFNLSSGSIRSQLEGSAHEPPLLQVQSPLMNDLRMVAGLHPTGEEWECPKCTLVNESKFAECEVCGYYNEPLIKIRSALQKECKTRSRRNLFIRGKNWVVRWFGAL